MKKRLMTVLLCATVLFSTLITGISAVAPEVSSSRDIRVIRGYSDEKGSWSVTDDGTVELNGSGAASLAQRIVWDPNALSGESGVEFIVTYRADYSNCAGSYGNYRFAVGLMDSRTFQGSPDGNGLGVDYRLVEDQSGNIRMMGFCYQGEADRNLSYPNRNNTMSVKATAGVAIKCKICYQGGAWKIWYDRDLDGVIDTLVGQFAPGDTCYPTNLISGGKAYLVFGSYNSNLMDMSIRVTNVYGSFRLQDEPDGSANGVTRRGENIALEDQILTRFYVKYEDAVLAAGGSVRLTLKASEGSAHTDVSKVYTALTDGRLYTEGTDTFYYYTMPVPASRGADTVEIVFLGANGAVLAQWSTSVTEYCNALYAQTDAGTDAGAALRALCSSVKSYCDNAKLYFDLINP